MPKISIKPRITIQPKKFHSVGCEIEFSDIETGGDVKAQIEECVAAVEQASQPAEEVLAKQLSNYTGLNIEGVGFAAEFEEFKGKVRDWAQEMIDEMKELKAPKKTRKKKE